MKFNVNSVTGFVAVIVFASLLIIFGPLVTIWSMNTLFGTKIEYSFTSWAAMAWLTTVTFGGLQTALRKKED